MSKQLNLSASIAIASMALFALFTSLGGASEPARSGGASLIEASAGL